MALSWSFASSSPNRPSKLQYPTTTYLNLEAYVKPCGLRYVVLYDYIDVDPSKVDPSMLRTVRAQSKSFANNGNTYGDRNHESIRFLSAAALV